MKNKAYLELCVLGHDHFLLFRELLLGFTHGLLHRVHHGWYKIGQKWAISHIKYAGKVITKKACMQAPCFGTLCKPCCLFALGWSSWLHPQTESAAHTQPAPFAAPLAPGQQRQIPVNVRNKKNKTSKQFSNGRYWLDLMLIYLLHLLQLLIESISLGLGCIEFLLCCFQLLLPLCLSILHLVL